MTENEPLVIAETLDSTTLTVKQKVAKLKGITLQSLLMYKEELMASAGPRKDNDPIALRNLKEGVQKKIAMIQLAINLKE